jgi:Flp pilus assembly protein TadG
MSASRPRTSRGDDGSVIVLMTAFALCLLLLTSVVIDLSGAYLCRQSTASLADGAALSASDAAAAAAVYGQGGDRYVPIDEDAARHAVAAYLSDTGALSRYPGLRASVEVVADRTIVVQLLMPYDLPISVPGASDAVVIKVQSSAELPVY